MTLTIALANGDENTYSNIGISYAVVELKDPSIVAGARNGVYGTGYQSLTIALATGEILKFAENNPAYRPNGYAELSDAKTPKEVYDDIVTETEFDQIAPKSGTGFDADFPFAMVVNKNNTTGILTQSTVPGATIYGPTTAATLTVKGHSTIWFYDTTTFKNRANVGPNYISPWNGAYYLEGDEFTALKTALVGLC